ncbi:prepilin-type N-terminal cleavage/methylation domain-containing protein [Pelagicoccus sp. SDUM812003]|uniref:type IV pilus modification PilV family protein n=1 Tax=Pelagicoccus sp. SDUM812003 TaxID=3041267 RepID=UPI00280FB44C|nr:prepilin-type N-terminal cleavage/methylation domain-containing protein [Pelagicoccus sp. SDUM812003]MDQ8203682.1 prepilin-type N-terminal cleavage/methylation domain-containing protein [Pelagicoccus sp. SDUM812003]
MNPAPPLPKKSIHASLSRSDGYSLIELMIATVILSLLAFGTLSGLLQVRRLTEGSIQLGTATAVAQGYIEQMKNMEYSLLDQSSIEELINQGAADSLAVSPMPADPEAGNENSDILNTRLIDINNTPDDEADDLAINYVVYVEDITNEAAGVSDARRIILRWSYQNPGPGSAQSVGNTLYAIRSRVPTF